MRRHRHTNAVVAALCLVLLLASPSAAAPKFALPISCKIGVDCFVQNYVDQDPTKSALDHRCGGQTYNGHKGTDFRLRNFKAMERGVNVLASAKGKVKALRTGMRDVSINDADTTNLKGKECGNGVVIDHGNGWVTQYCHMKNGSLKVKQGQTVKAGTVLGQVGLSGMTEFAHLHFEVRHGTDIIDPFTAMDTLSRGTGVCVSKATLWNTKAASALDYQPATLIEAGFTNQTPTLSSIERAEPERPTSVSAALVAYIRVMGIRSGDIETIIVTNPLNETFAESGPKPIEKSKAHWLSFAGRKRTAPSWPLGNYKARYTLTRQGKTLIEREFSFSLVR